MHNEIADAIRALRDAFRHAGVPYNAKGYYTLTISPQMATALMAEADYEAFADQQTFGQFYYEGFDIRIDA